MGENETHQLRRRLDQLNRELAIESILRKVNSRAISMRSSSEIADTSALLYGSLKELGIHAIRCGVGIYDDEANAIELWLTAVDDNGETQQIFDYMNLGVHPVYERIIPARKSNKPYALTVLTGEQVREFYQTTSFYLTQTKKKAYNPEEYYYWFFFPKGSLFLVTPEGLSDEDRDILSRFAEVYGQIYMHFQDLKQVESHTRQAKQQSALNGIRAEIASMHTASDLNQITPMVWNVLSNLNVPFIRCGLFIMDQDHKTVQAYLSTPEAKSLAVLNLAFDESDTIRQMVDHWVDQKIYREQWSRTEFQQWVKSLLQKGKIEGVEKFTAHDSSFEILHLQFVPFAQGMLYIGSRESLDYNHVELAESLAESFSVAYSRHLDFKQLEEAKNKLERAFKELKATQAQLIHAEKMASLGELTAGIAHEIQNPLNFVNNFSEVSAELIGEMLEEFEKGDADEVRAIASDLRENLEKIVHHGQRADAIVKGMLQHSRISDGQKEPTDLGALAEEYFRLAYHGLRARDKSFNATLETDLDPKVGLVNIAPQEIGRVLLNLFTNAFHAVNEKARQGPSGYVPTVTLRTARQKEQVVVSVSDNGNGIPEAIREKIFQPFFTTKPTGQGTGLGLSLSYDIVKAHGGVILVTSEEGKGTEFTIKLPLK